MTKSNGIKSLKQAAKLLNKHAPDGESLAYINPEEARLLKSHGGSGIMTVSGVRSYELPDWMKNIYTSYIEPAAKWLGYSGDEGGGRLLKDVTSLGGGYVGWQEAQELSDFQKKQYEEAKAKEIMNQLKFAQESGQGEQLLTQQNVPSKIEDVSRFTEVDIPTMTTTAAHGGRIGAFNGGIQGLMPQQGFMPQPGLDPRMGYAQGVGPMERPMGPGVSENLEFVDKIFSDEAKTLAGMSGVPDKGLLQETKYDRDTNTRDFTFSEDITMPGQEHTRETLDAANQMLDIQEMKKLQLEKLALKKGWTKEQFDKRYWELVKRQRGGPEGWGPYTQYDDLNEALSMLEHDIGVWSNWEGDQDPESVDMRLQEPNYLPLPSNFTSSYEPNAQGGRIGAQEGGIMPLLNLGGMEKDYRQEGGFVPIGRKEKADDVPARLSKNEFVFTADAVRAAGGGDIDQGAQRMYNVMKNLEAGGEISEQSQGKG